MVLNAAVQMLSEADELKQKILKFKSGISMLQERSLWATQQQLQKVYQKVLVLDLDYALDKKVEQDLWNVGFKQQIEALQAISKDRKNPLRSEGQAMLSWVLQAAAGFYLCLLHQICTTFKLDLPFRRRASLLGWVEGWGAGEAATGAKLPPPAAARYICQHCLVHLGDLARYRQQLRVAHTFYRHALVVSAHSGQPYNQLALVAWRRGRRLAALYWHVRSLLVRAPFPPAPANLARTLAAAAAAAATTANTTNTTNTNTNTSRDKDLPVLPGVTPTTPPPTEPAPTAAAVPGRLDSHSYVNELIRAMHLIHTLEDLETASALVERLNSSLTALIATDGFESMTLIKMSCVLMWLVHSSTEEFAVGAAALSADEAAARRLCEQLAAGALLALLLALLLPATATATATATGAAAATATATATAATRPLPALKVWLAWAAAHPAALRSDACSTRPQLWAALAHVLGTLAAPLEHFDGERYACVPLPEDEELHGFRPLEASFGALRFASRAAWDAYGGRLPEVGDDDATDLADIEPPSEVSSICLSNEPELERKVRAYRIVQLGKQLAELHSEHLSFTEEDGKITFTATSVGTEQLSAALAELSAAAAARGAGAEPEPELEPDDDSDDDRPPPPPPIVISEADFREKVREKRVGILKPQGSLERAREERALASTQDDQEVESVEDGGKEDKKEARKPRVNIAMAAIMRKQEESNKQVKFVTPPPTPDSTTDKNAASPTKDQDKPKIIQPKVIKSLASLPLGRKTGGILSLKDKSAGYPHLVNTDPEPAKKNDKEEKKEVKTNQGSSQSSQQTYPQKRQDHPPSPNWGANVAPQNTFSDVPRMNFQKNYGLQNTGISYNPSYQVLPNVNNQGIRLPVVNPKEIDVRTAALQKQNSRQDVFQEGHKFGNHNYQMSGDKKNFLNDLPPRFANQYRYWQNAQENQYNENKFRDDSFKANNNMFNQQQQRPSWNTPQMPDTYQQAQVPWWKPETPPSSFNMNFAAQPLNMQSNYFSPHLPSNNMSSPFQNMTSYNQLQNQGAGLQSKSENLINTPSYLQSAIGQPQFQTLQNLVTSPNFSSSLNSFGSYAPTPTVGYDSAMYPQFNNNKLGYQTTQMKMPDKAQVGYQGSKELMNIGGLGFGSNVLDLQQRNMSMSYGDPLNSEMGAMKNMDQIGMGEGTSNDAATAGNTYSLFSGAVDTNAWGAAQRHTQQSLWSGPGPSPLERLLEQQKQMKQPAAPQ